VLAGTTASLRAYQRASLRDMFQTYLDAPRTAVEVQWRSTGADTWSGFWKSSPGDYYVIEYEGTGRAVLPAVSLNYDAPTHDTDYTRIVPISDERGVNRLFVPLYGEPGLWDFSSLEITDALKTRMRSISRIARPEALPFLLDLRLDSSWRDGDLAQHLQIEGTRTPDAVRVFGSPGSNGVSRFAWAARAWSGEQMHVGPVRVRYSPAVLVDGMSVRMDGRAETESAYLVEFQETTARSAGALLARGTLSQGGLALGVLRGGRWGGQAIVTEPGTFVALVGVDAGGSYVPIITNATRSARDVNRFTLSTFGIR
jgi:hypothetical protein